MAFWFIFLKKNVDKYIGKGFIICSSKRNLVMVNAWNMGKLPLGCEFVKAVTGFQCRLCNIHIRDASGVIPHVDGRVHRNNYQVNHYIGSCNIGPLLLGCGWSNSPKCHGPPFSQRLATRGLFHEILTKICTLTIFDIKITLRICLYMKAR